MTLGMILEHMLIVLSASLLSIAVGLPLGIWAYVSPKMRAGILRIVDLLQFFLLSLHDQKDAWARYLRLVRRAGTASYTELCETAGLQVPFNDGSIKAIAQQMSQWIAEHQV